MSKAKEVQEAIGRWCDEVTRRHTVEQLSDAQKRELVALKCCLDLVEKTFGLEPTEKVTI